MIKERYYHASTIVNNKLVVAGYDKDVPIEVLDLNAKSSEWQPVVTHLFSYKLNPVVATLNEHEVIIAGGNYGGYLN